MSHNGGWKGARAVLFQVTAFPVQQRTQCRKGYALSVRRPAVSNRKHETEEPKHRSALPQYKLKMKIPHWFVIVLIVGAIAGVACVVKAGATHPNRTWFEITPSTTALSVSDLLTVTVAMHYDGEGCPYHIFELGLYERGNAYTNFAFVSPALLNPGQAGITNVFTLTAIYSGTPQLFASAFGEYGGTVDCPWNWAYINSEPITITISGTGYREYLPVVAK